MAAILAAILVGAATGSSDAAMGGIAMAQGAAMQQQINFTRANENEADRVGMAFLAAAGFDPYGMPDFFETMGRRSPASPRQPQRAAGNPANAPRHHQSHRRVARARRAIQGPQADRRERELHAHARAPARAATPAEDNVRRYYADRREQQPDGGRALRRSAG